MRTGIGLTCIALGAILAFAVKGSPSWLNIHTVGWVLMIVGLIGIVLSRRVYTWLSRRTMVRRVYPDGRVEQVQMPAHGAGVPAPQPVEDDLLPQAALTEDQDGNLIEEPAYRPPAQARHRTEVVEDLYEQP
jgi:hypothetical protein